MSGTASAPASSGNLGPGFDCIALALELRCEVTAEPGDRWEIFQDGETTYPGEDDFVVRAARMAVDRPMRLEIDNAIPRSRGLGSSSAVTAAAAAASWRALGLPCAEGELFDIVNVLEGHADNAAAAVYGGLVLAGPGGSWRHLEMADGLRIVVAVPEYKLSTDTARAALPPSVGLGAVVRNLARVGFLIEGLRTGDPAALAAAGCDEIHEEPRRGLSPLTGRLMSVALAAGAFHASWSGAGPSALAICTEETKPGVVDALSAELGAAGTVLEPSVATHGIS